MTKSGITIIEDLPGSGPLLQKGDRVRLIYDIALNRGEVLFRDQEAVWTVGDRNILAGFRYGMEGMRVGGSRTFTAAPHLCYRGEAVAGIPPSAALVVTIRTLEPADADK